MDGPEARPQTGSGETGPIGDHCPRCGSTDVVAGLRFNQNVEVGPFGISYTVLGFLSAVETLRADLCRNCGTVTRFYVKNANRKWSMR